MYVRVGLTNGDVFTSDMVDNDEVAADLARDDWEIGTDYKTGRPVVVDNLDEAFDKMEEMFKDIMCDRSVDKANMTITMNGNDRIIDAAHVMWFELVR